MFQVNRDEGIVILVRSLKHFNRIQLFLYSLGIYWASGRRESVHVTGLSGGADVMTLGYSNGRTVIRYSNLEHTDSTNAEEYALEMERKMNKKYYILNLDYLQNRRRI